MADGAEEKEVEGERWEGKDGEEVEEERRLLALVMQERGDGEMAKKEAAEEDGMEKERAGGKEKKGRPRAPVTRAQLSAPRPLPTVTTSSSSTYTKIATATNHTSSTRRQHACRDMSRHGR